MAETGNFQLKQWEKTDRIQMEDFNADNAKTDQALAEQRDELVALTAAMALYGNCQLYCGSYTGTGSYGTNNPNQFTFPKTPVLAMVVNSDTQFLLLKPGNKWAWLFKGNVGVQQVVTWSGNTVSWYSSSNAGDQMNNTNVAYTVLAIWRADE